MYKWKLMPFDGDPEKVAEELKNFNGEITKFNIVTYAKLHPKSELHKCFNWDNKSAALYWRYKQATDIMRSLVIIKEISKGIDKIDLEIRVYESVHSEESNGVPGENRRYVEVESAIENEYLRKEIIEGIIIMLQKAQKKLNKYNMLIKDHGIIQDKIEDAINQIELAL